MFILCCETRFAPFREQFALIDYLLPVQRGNVAIDNLTVLSGISCVALNTCTRRGLPRKYGR